MTLHSKFDPSKHHRRSIRLKGFDYTKPGFYFVTLNTHGAKKLFGKIVNGKMILNTYGQLVEFTWFDLPNHNIHVRLDAFVIMPDHFHCIIELTAPKKSENPPVRHPLSEVVRQLKTFSARRINDSLGRVQNPTQQNPTQQNPTQQNPTRQNPTQQNPTRQNPTRQNPTRRSESVWQRDYYERIIRNERQLSNVRNYIIKNPSNYR